MRTYIKAFALTGLMVLSGSALAEWRFLFPDSLGNEFFIDMESIKTDGNFRKVWVYMNFAKSEDGTKSIRMKSEYDCTAERYKNSSMSTFSEKNLKGKILTNGNTSSEWFDIAPNSGSSIYLEVVCR